MTRSSAISTEIIVRRGQPIVRIKGLGGGSGEKIEAHRLPNGQIVFSRPERVPRYLKNTVVPALFADYQRKVLAS